MDGRITQAIKNRVESCVKDCAGHVVVYCRDVEYIMGTGRNWNGPIGKLVLRIEKESPDQFLAVCFPGSPKKAGPTVVEYTQTDFVPPDRLVVYF